MGLSISVGILAELGDDEEGLQHHRGQFQRLSEALVRAGAPAHREPASLQPGLARPHVGSFPYSFLHYLRRAYALTLRGRPVTPTNEDGLDADHPLVEDETESLSSHLLCHSDSEGYYVPSPLPRPLLLRGHPELGGLVGSSQGLLEELRQVAPALGVTLGPDGALGDAEAARLAGLEDDATPLFRELTVWLALHEACRASIASGAAIVFC